jgi:hypothetical protein
VTQCPSARGGVFRRPGRLLRRTTTQASRVPPPWLLQVARSGSEWRLAQYAPRHLKCESPRRRRLRECAVSPRLCRGSAAVRQQHQQSRRGQRRKAINVSGREQLDHVTADDAVLPRQRDDDPGDVPERHTSRLRPSACWSDAGIQPVAVDRDEDVTARRQLIAEPSLPALVHLRRGDQAVTRRNGLLELKRS